MGKEKENNKGFYDNLWGKASGFYEANKKLVDICLVVALFLVLAGIRIHDINIKKQLHSDEVFSLMLSTCNDYYNQPVPDGEYTGEQLKRIITVDDEGGVKGAADDIAKLWHNNGDAPHASLYYMVLRVALIGFDAFDVHELSWRGGGLNLMFFALSFFFMYKLLRRIYGANMLLVLAGLAMAFGNWMSIRNTLLIREYQMAETGIIVLTLMGVALIQALRVGKNTAASPKYALWFGLIIAYIVSLGYFNSLYVLAFGGALIISCFKYKRRDLVPWLLASGVVALIVALVMYPGFFNFLLHDSVHKERAFSSVRNVFKYVFVRDIAFQFFTVYGTLIFAISVLAVVLSNKRKRLFKSENFAWIPIIALCCMVAIMCASVLKMPRYYYSLMPMLALIVPHVLSCVPKAWSGYFELLVVIYFPAINIMFPVKPNYGWKKLTEGMNVSSELFRLNPNEVVQLVPCMNDTLKYKISSEEFVDIKKDRETYVVTTEPIGLNNDSIKSMKRLLWGRHIYMYKFRFERNDTVGN